MNNKDWKKDIQAYCKQFNLPLEYLAETLNEPKVVPMIRGKAFEFSVMLALKEVLPSKTWDVIKIPMNAQQGIHDVDVLVIHKPTKTKIRIECKLSGKGSYRCLSDSTSTVRVKCMRSRTLGAAMVKLLAPRFKVSEEQLMIHNDQYLPTDFDVVITSIANSFYTTQPTTGTFIWNPIPKGIEFLEKMAGKKPKDYQAFAFNQMYLAKTSDIVINEQTAIGCTREKCTLKSSCGFLPNYPLIKFTNGVPVNNWYSLKDAEKFFKSLILSIQKARPLETLD